MPRIYITIGAQGRIVNESYLFALMLKRFRTHTSDLEAAILALSDLGPVIVKEESRI